MLKSDLVKITKAFEATLSVEDCDFDYTYTNDDRMALFKELILVAENKSYQDDAEIIPVTLGGIVALLIIPNNNTVITSIYSIDGETTTIRAHHIGSALMETREAISKHPAIKKEKK